MKHLTQPIANLFAAQHSGSKPVRNQAQSLDLQAVQKALNDFDRYLERASALAQPANAKASKPGIPGSLTETPSGNLPPGSGNTLPINNSKTLPFFKSKTLPTNNSNALPLTNADSREFAQLGLADPHTDQSPQSSMLAQSSLASMPSAGYTTAAENLLADLASQQASQFGSPDKQTANQTANQIAEQDKLVPTGLFDSPLYQSLIAPEPAVETGRESASAALDLLRGDSAQLAPDSGSKTGFTVGSIATEAPLKPDSSVDTARPVSTGDLGIASSPRV